MANDKHTTVDWMFKVARSCQTPEQLATFYNLIDNFNKKFPRTEYTFIFKWTAKRAVVTHRKKNIVYHAIN